MSLLTLAFSTTDGAFQSFFRRLERFPHINGINYLVVCQELDDGSFPNKIKDEFNSDRPDVSIHSYSETGLSRSRNRAIAECKSTYIWFLDDDVFFDFDLICGRLVGILQDAKIDIVLCEIGSLEDENQFYKDYSFRSRKIGPTRLQLLKASSIEIICRREFLQTSRIRFDERIGLGTPYPCAEEIIFLLDLFDQGASIQYLNYSLVRHTTLKGARLPARIGHFQARGDVAKRFSCFVRFGLIARWASRVGAVPVLQRLEYLIKGLQDS